MKLKSLAHLPACRKMGALEYTDKANSGATCLAAFCRLHGRAIQMNDLRPYSMMPGVGDAIVSSRQFLRLGRRFGVALQNIDPAEVANVSRREVVLVQNRDGYCFLLLPHGGGAYCAALPGYPGNYFQIDKKSDLLDKVASAFILRKTANPPARTCRAAYFWLLPQVEQAPLFDAADVARQQQRRRKAKGKEQEGACLRGWDIQDLLQAHRELIDRSEALEWYGCWRTAEFLRSDRMFAPCAEIEWRCQRLLRIAQQQWQNWQAEQVSLEQVADFCARLYADFNAIHPFYNANHRLGIALLEYCLHGTSWCLLPLEIKKGQHYFRVRCAHRGHIKGLRDFFLKHVQRQAEK